MHKRRRITDAIAELTAEQGYEATKIADLVRRAAVARKTLYEYFEGKEAVLLAAVDGTVEEMLKVTAAACEEAGEEWEEKVNAGLGALLGYMAEHPARAHVTVVEALSATPDSTRHHEQAMQRFVELVSANAPGRPDLPETTAETLVGGISWILHQQIRREGAEGLPELLPELCQFLVRPYLPEPAKKAKPKAKGKAKGKAKRSAPRRK